MNTNDQRRVVWKSGIQVLILYNVILLGISYLTLEQTLCMISH